MNRLLLSAEVVQRGLLRYTPAGLPALDLSLKHTSEVSEDGQPRKVQMELRAVAIGGVSKAATAIPLGQTSLFGGFLSAARNGRGVLFHITTVLAAPDPTEAKALNAVPA